MILWYPASGCFRQTLSAGTWRPARVSLVISFRQPFHSPCGGKDLDVSRSFTLIKKSFWNFLPLYGKKFMQHLPSPPPSFPPSSRPLPPSTTNVGPIFQGPPNTSAASMNRGEDQVSFIPNTNRVLLAGSPNTFVNTEPIALKWIKLFLCSNSQLGFTRIVS